MLYDVFVIGAGITGSMIARELSRYELSVAIIDKENDIGNVTSNANSAIIHSGYDPLPGTLKAKLNVLSNPLFDKICEDLDVSFSRIGSLTVAIEDSQLPLLKELENRSKENGVDVTLLNGDQVKQLEPNINPNVKGALLAPTCGIINVFELTTHAMENAVDNGVICYLDEEVLSIDKESDHYVIKTNKHTFEARVIINAAGLGCEKISRMVYDVDWHLTPRKGEYFLISHQVHDLVRHVVFPLPSEKGKGILVSLTTSGDYIVGPSSEPSDADDVSTDPKTLENIKEQGSSLIFNIPFSSSIRTFAGVRPTTTRHDFIIETIPGQDHFIQACGIESPGIASSPMIAKMVVDLVGNVLSMKEKKNFNPKIRKHIHFNSLSLEEKNKLIEKDKDFGKIVCYCEHITLGEIKDELSRSTPPKTIKAVKRRTRAGMGNCQGGYCSSTILFYLAKYFNELPTDIKYDKDDSNVLLKKVKANDQ